MDTRGTDYAKRLADLESVWWKRLLDVQRPYRAHLRRLGLGFVLDVGCGIGRNLVNLGVRSGVGVDHNPQAVALARAKGVEAFTIEQFHASRHARPGSFDTLLLSHVVEHMSESEAVCLLAGYRRFLRRQGKVVMITPQECGYRSDATHVRFVDFIGASSILRQAGLAVQRQYSFPLPRLFGNLFRYNEFVTIGVETGAPA